MLSSLFLWMMTHLDEVEYMFEGSLDKLNFIYMNNEYYFK